MKYTATNKNTSNIGLIDVIDSDLIMPSVNLHSDGYARKGSVKIHRVIMERIINSKIPRNKVVDHKNRNRLDNRRNNLRLCSIEENKRNVGKFKGTSKYKGVSWKKSKNKWCSQIKTKGKVKHLGLFDNQIDAAKRYNEEALLLHGDFAFLNSFDESVTNNRTRED